MNNNFFATTIKEDTLKFYVDYLIEHTKGLNDDSEIDDIEFYFNIVKAYVHYVHEGIKNKIKFVTFDVFKSEVIKGVAEIMFVPVVEELTELIKDLVKDFK